MIPVVPLARLFGGQRFGFAEEQRQEARFGDVFEHDGGLQSVARSLAKRERAVVRQQHCRRPGFVLKNRFADVVTLIIHVGRAGDSVAELVGDGGEISRYRPSEQRKRRGVIRVRVDDAADLGTMAVKIKVVRQIHGRFVTPFDFAAVEVGHHKVRRAERVVVHAARLDQHEAALAVNAARVPRVHGHEARAKDLAVGLPNFPAEVLERWHGSKLSVVSRQLSAFGHRSSVFATRQEPRANGCPAFVPLLTTDN